MRSLESFILISAACQLAFFGVTDSARGEIEFTTDPLTRCVHVAYEVPPDAPDETVVSCSWSIHGKNDWQPARVMPRVSETGLELVDDEQWNQWALRGCITERRAAGLTRTLIWNPYPDACIAGRLDADLRIQLSQGDDKPFWQSVKRIQVDQTDVIYIEDWTKVLQSEQVGRDGPASQPADKQPGWIFRSRLAADKHLSRNDALYGTSDSALPLPQLTYPLNLKGWYAIYVATSVGSEDSNSIRLRLSGDEASDTLSSRRVGEEVLWKWARMDRQHIVLRQPHQHTGYAPAHVDYVKLVPLTPSQVQELEDQFGKPDKLVAAYWEPYSWAFYENVQTPAQHREPLAAYAWARIGLVDAQMGRVGMKVVYETRATDQLVYRTFGDPIEGNVTPVTTNVGRMQQYTNTLENELRYARELGLNLHANFGAGACYNGTPLQGEISKQHPEWLRGNTLRYEVPEVRTYVLSLYREALEIGSPGLSIDFCRYPEGVDSAETGNTLMRELRQLADDFGKARGRHVPVLVRFPGTGVRLHDRFDYRTWAREGLVDYLCPSNLQGRHMNIDMTPYVDAVRGTACQLLPAFDGLTWGLPLPGPFFWRVREVYDAGVPGIYVYQSDARVLGPPAERRWMRMLASSEAVRNWWQRSERERPAQSKGIYLSRPEGPGEAYHGYERLRIWTDGVPMGPLEIYLDGKLVSQFERPPYLVGTEDYESDKVIPPGKHELRVRAKDGEGWLEQRFEIVGG